MADVEWGFPSLTNFYKQVPHCFAFDETQKKYVGNFATDAYIQGMDMAKDYVTKKIYGYDQYSATEGGARKAYNSNNCGILYENLSLTNYEAIRTALLTSNSLDANFNVDDASAIMSWKQTILKSNAVWYCGQSITRQLTGKSLRTHHEKD